MCSYYSQERRNYKRAFQENKRVLDVCTSLVLCGSFARYEMTDGSDCDWTLLVDGGVDVAHQKIALEVQKVFKSGKDRGLKAPGSSGIFGNICFSHNLVHRIGGNADLNENLTRRLLMILESKPLSFSPADNSDTIWEGVVRNVLERYFEEDVHFSATKKRKVPRFLFNDLTRYWRTICVDYAGKHWDQGEAKWALRNAKLRFSRKLLYAAGIAFCFACQLDPPESSEVTLFGEEKDETPKPYIDIAVDFARTPPLDYLAAFVRAFVPDDDSRKIISTKVFGSYNEWLGLLGQQMIRDQLASLTHDSAPEDPLFNDQIRKLSKEFASGLKLLFFNRDTEPDNPIANLSLEYVGF